jgi:glyoxylase-like metal-dependent hydrolase (beta-lactamase superfamily II)
MTGPRHYSIGNAEIFRVTEQLIEIPSARLFPDHQDELSAAGLPDKLELSIHSWIIRMPNRLIVVDTGIGNDRDRDGNPLFDHLHTDFVQRLEAAGVDRQQVDTVLMTHLHIDHVGWNTYHDGNGWKPMFPNARYVMSAHGLEHWKQDPKRQTIYGDSIKPVIDAGLAHVIDDWNAVDLGDGLRCMPTPGHSPDHAVLTLESKGSCALFGGDVMHHPAQVAHPHWNSTFCEHKPGAAASRRKVLQWSAEHQALYFSAHFANSSAGRIEQAADKPDSYAWHFA